MKVRVRFLGAAKTVTGSKYLFEINGFRLLVDCGLFQGLKELRLRNWSDLPQNPEDIDAVIVTHSHIDHIGYLPRLFKQGYQGPLYCTNATADLMQIMLKDSAKIQEEEAEFAKRKGYSRHAKPEPLYTVEDAEMVFAKLAAKNSREWIDIHPGISIKFSDAGHILGSAIVQIKLQQGEWERNIVMSGDLGRFAQPVLDDPKTIEHADMLVVESTYGDKNNPPVSPKKSLAEIVNQTHDKGCVIIPAFALGRTQLVVYYLKQLLDEGEIPNIPIYIDSPMAISVTALYKKHFTEHKLRETELEESVFDYHGLRYCQTPQESKAINSLEKNAIIISASGMCTGGRIVHHLFHRLPRINDTLLFVGYQAVGTRGRRILDGEPTIRIFGQDVASKCRVEQISGLSAHADRSELLKWLGNFKNSPEHTFITHGEPDSAHALAEAIKNKWDWSPIVPDYLQWHRLFQLD